MVTKRDYVTLISLAYQVKNTRNTRTSHQINNYILSPLERARISFYPLWHWGWLDGREQVSGYNAEVYEGAKKNLRRIILKESKPAFVKLSRPLS